MADEDACLLNADRMSVICAKTCGVCQVNKTDVNYVAPTTAPYAYFDCNTSTCARHDEWFPIPTVGQFVNYTKQCEKSLTAAMESFAPEAIYNCESGRRSARGWPECRAVYCGLAEGIVDSITIDGGAGYFGGSECRPLLNFNRTLCETSYRDAEAFCECICPSLLHLEAAPVCKNEVMEFFSLGRRGPELAQRFSISPFCIMSVCNWFEDMASPDVPKDSWDYGGVPDMCMKLHLPEIPGQCAEILAARADYPYDPCPFLKPTEEAMTLRCTSPGLNPKTCLIDPDNADSWSCCDKYNKRKQCPPEWPVMCSKPRECNGMTDNCCEQTVDDCSTGERKECSPMLSMELSEWLGIANAGMRMPNAEETTTTMYRFSEITTTKGTQFGAVIRDQIAWFLIALGVIGGFVSVIVCTFVVREHYRRTDGIMFGPSRMQAIMKGNNVVSFKPTGASKYAKKLNAPLPDLLDPVVEEAKRIDAETTHEMQAAVRNAYAIGQQHLVHDVGAPPPLPEAPLRQAISTFRARPGLKGRAGSEVWEELVRGERWLRIVDAERTIVGVIAGVRPDLRDGGRGFYSENPLAGAKPWRTTFEGRILEGSVKVNRWERIESLAEAIRVAKESSASDGLVAEAQGVYAELVARTRELPADRCVIDPAGNGVKLLPRGERRAIYGRTGEVYTYEAGAAEGHSTEDSMPHPSLLGDVDVDPCRPVCANFHKKGACHVGRECPWRHCRATESDVIREPVLWGEP